jgi:uncharacterized protein (TIGR02611 family)
VKWHQHPAGERFQTRYHQHHERNLFVRGFNVILGTLLILVGIPLVPLPGPGWVIIFLGLGGLSGESLRLARVLDWLDHKLGQHIVGFARNHPYLLTLFLWCFLFLFIYASWNWSPQWDLGPLHWGDWDQTYKEIKSEF